MAMSSSGLVRAGAITQEVSSEKNHKVHVIYGRGRAWRATCAAAWMGV